jgi:hypothetical protein
MLVLMMKFLWKKEAVSEDEFLSLKDSLCGVWTRLLWVTNDLYNFLAKIPLDVGLLALRNVTGWVHALVKFINDNYKMERLVDDYSELWCEIGSWNYYTLSWIFVTSCM